MRQPTSASGTPETVVRCLLATGIEHGQVELDPAGTVAAAPLLGFLTLVEPAVYSPTIRSTGR